MDLKTKQLVDRNKLGLLANHVVCGSVLFISLIGLYQEITTDLIIRSVMCVLIIIINVAAHKALRLNEKYIHFCCISMLCLYIYTMLSTRTPEMYSVLFSIAILVMGFQNIRLSVEGSIIAILTLIPANIRWYKLGVTDNSTIFISFLYAAGACLLAIIISKKQIEHTNESVEGVEKAAKEQAKTANEMNGLAAELAKKFNEAKSVSDELNDKMESSHSAMIEIADSTKATAEAVQVQSSQTADIQESILTVGEQAKEMDGIAQRVGKSVDEGVKIIQKLKGQAAEVEKINTETKSTTEALNESIKDVQAITETILGISNQTNLLALNASIEAARAGEAGKGFAVVADEIRTLSEGTRKATEQISEIISRLTTDAQQAANSMMLSADYAQKQNVLIAETGNKLDTIMDETDELNKEVYAVNESVQHIVKANSSIMDSITNLSATSQEVSASTETVMTVSDASMTALGEMNTVLAQINKIATRMDEISQGKK